MMLSSTNAEPEQVAVQYHFCIKNVKRSMCFHLSVMNSGQNKIGITQMF